MFLSGLLGSSGRDSSSRPKSRNHQRQDNKSTSDPSPSRRPRSPDPASTVYISDESQLRAVQPLPQGTLDLNKSLEVLAGVFPDVQIEVFREMLSSFSEESRLAVVADAMLKNPTAHVKGRRRLQTPGIDGQSTPEEALVPKTEAFRGNEYRNAVRSIALSEFKGLSRSSIDAVLSEYNFSYLDARPTLIDLSTKSWKFTIQSIFFRRKPVTTGEAENHPLVVWRSSGYGSIIPSIKSTNNPELDRELFEELIMPLKRREAELREENDHTLAVSLNNEEAETHEATYECTCCYADVSFEEVTTCSSTEGHIICFRCVQHSITEAVFGQGWIRSINKDRGTLLCPAVSSSTTECTGCISSEHTYRAMQAQKNGAEILHKMDQRLAEHSLIASGVPLIRCPFCSYAEVDDLYVPSSQQRLRLRASNIPNILLALLCSLILPLSLLLLCLGVVALVLSANSTTRGLLTSRFRSAISRYQRRRLGLKFTCRNPTCARPSCLSCSKAWVDIHMCHESSLVALRTQVEQAMSAAVKRVCPRCGTSFVKTSGCNKLTCPCGYKMCYVCRRDIGAAAEGYAHFCPHFRPEGDGSPCAECSRCNLWEAEDTEAVLRAARKQAEERWRATERRELSGAEKAYLETGVASRKDDVVSRFVSSGGKMPTLDEIFDYFVETLFIVGS